MHRTRSNWPVNVEGVENLDVVVYVVVMRRCVPVGRLGGWVLSVSLHHGRSDTEAGDNRSDVAARAAFGHCGVCCWAEEYTQFLLFRCHSRGFKEIHTNAHMHTVAQGGLQNIHSHMTG